MADDPLKSMRKKAAEYLLLKSNQKKSVEQGTVGNGITRPLHCDGQKVNVKANSVSLNKAHNIIKTSDRSCRNVLQSGSTNENSRVLKDGKLDQVLSGFQKLTVADNHGVHTNLPSTSKIQTVIEKRTENRRKNSSAQIRKTKDLSSLRISCGERTKYSNRASPFPVINVKDGTPKVINGNIVEKSAFTNKKKRVATLKSPKKTRNMSRESSACTNRSSDYSVLGVQTETEVFKPRISLSDRIMKHMEERRLGDQVMLKETNLEPYSKSNFRHHSNREVTSLVSKFHEMTIETAHAKVEKLPKRAFKKAELSKTLSKNSVSNETQSVPYPHNKICTKVSKNGIKIISESERRDKFDEICSRIKRDARSKYNSTNLERGKSSSLVFKTSEKIRDSNCTVNGESPLAGFRTSNLYFRKDDIEMKTDLKKNITKGSFPSVDQYLEIQFNLLREDFVGTIRDDIAILSMTRPCENRKGTMQIKVYKEAKFIKYEVKNNKCGILVQFDPKTKSQNNSLFMQGSLLGFTKDNFQNYFFATVVDQCKKGEVLVKTCDEKTLSEVSSSVFTMMEPLVFFEPYFHVMKALQCLNESNFPMKRYIIDGDCEKKAPAYLSRKVTYNIGSAQNVPVLNLDSKMWPSAEEMDLDSSQYRAFRTALTQEFVVIQGPPGTGKTYIGLKVAEVLLKNESAWHKGSSPIMVVCYTNHALDQFLEGLLDVTDKLVRVGGQSRSEALQPFNLKNQGKTVGWGFANDKREISKALHDSVNNMKSIGNDIIIMDKQLGILSLHYLVQRGIVSYDQVSCFGEINYFEDNSKQNFLFWLLYDDECQIENFKKHEEEYKKSIFNDETSLQNTASNFNSRQCELYYCLTKSDLEEKIQKIQDQMHVLQKSNRDHHFLYSKIWVLEEQCFEITEYLNRLTFFLSAEAIASSTLIDNFEEYLWQDLWKLNCYERWALYKYWEKQLKGNLIKMQDIMSYQAQLMEESYRKEMARCNAACLQHTLIFGMTTTGAARNQQVLQLLKPRIVIVEEAAEVMESHVVASLTPHCEHLILIGDHQQLRPNINVHELRLHFGFDISLFERMLNNGVNYETLQVQHRMRPEIVSLIVPTIYPKLQNHDSVYEFPPVKGVTANLFFVSHCVPEDAVNENSSHRNVHEVTFIIRLCKYLVLQGYSTEEITIITTYKAQMNSLKNERVRHDILHGVKISTVDDFQGEENKIILLSLVRSNDRANVGFLKTANRICVALSRAREGFYMIGNMENLSHQSHVWKKIQHTLIEQNAIGRGILLYCQNHPHCYTTVTTSDDFNSVPEGGCSVLCERDLQCEHKCLYKCHVIDLEHTNRYRCCQKCNRVVCKEGHKCSNLCWMECDKKCLQLVRRTLHCKHEYEMQCFVDWEKFKCYTPVLRELLCAHEIQLPCHVDRTTFACEVEVTKKKKCGHFVLVKCYEDVTEVMCPSRCNKELPCGHECMLQCHSENVSCGKCSIPTEKTFLSCGHRTVVSCCEDVQTMKCKTHCVKTLSCGHQCSAFCGDPCSACRVLVKLILPSCGHEISVQCGTIPSISDCRHQCSRKLRCGHTCSALCNEPCISVCSQPCLFKARGMCGHQIEVPCFKHESLDANSEELLSHCQEICNMTLPCGHKCKSKCSKCLQGRIHNMCTERCGKMLICGHRCDAPCYLSCPPCPLKYKYACAHGQRIKRCFRKLDPCTKPCVWECDHNKCTKTCGELCSCQPCNNACKKLLSCGHICIGYCGDLCPPLCRICDEEDVLALPGCRPDELNEATRFVQLIDCGHTFEATYLEDKIMQRDSEILMKVCPVCDAAIVNMPRYRNHVKLYFLYETAVKTRVFKKKRSIENQKQKAVHTLVSIMNKDHTRDKFKAYLGSIISKSHREFFDAETLQIEAYIVTELEKKLQLINKCEHSPVKWRGVAYVEVLMSTLATRGDYLCTEELESWHMELMRLQHIADICIIYSKITSGDSTLSKLVEDVTALAFASRKYSKEMNCEIMDLLMKIVPLVEWTLPDESISDDSQCSKIMGMCEGNWLKSNVQLQTKSQPNIPKKKQLNKESAV